MRITLFVAMLSLSGTAWDLCHAQDQFDVPPRLKDHFGVSYRLGFNFKANFKNIGSSPAANNPSLTGASYENGFVGTDQLGNPLGLTTFWGYQNLQSYDEPAVMGPSLLLRHSASGPLSSGEDNAGHGLELSYGRDLGQLANAYWGLEGAFGLNTLLISDSRQGGTSVLSVDAFSLRGVIPPQAPYSGPFVPGPGVPLLDVNNTQLPVTVSSRFAASLYSFRLGPYLDFPLWRYLQLKIAAGFALVVVDGEYSFTESFSPPGGRVLSRGASGRSIQPLPGGFASATLEFPLTQKLRLYTGIQYQGTTEYSKQVSDKKVELKTDQTLYWLTGVSILF